MRRPIIFVIIFLTIDQLLKWYFQINFTGQKMLLFGDWGVTFVTNKGVWINNNMPLSGIIAIQLFSFFWMILTYICLKSYKRCYRDSVFMDLSFSLYVSCIVGNIFIDRLLFGYIRDYLVTPFGIANFADICIDLSIIFFIMELILFPQARRMFKGKHHM